MNSFSIDYTTGDVTMHQRQLGSSPPHQLLIRAKDSGVPTLSTTATFVVNIIDVNDHVIETLIS